MESEAHTPFVVGEWEVHPRMNRLTNGTDEFRISPKFMHVLLRLADAKGEVVTRDELMDSVWPDTVVGEAVLTRAVSELRKVLNPNERSEPAIETIPTVGYRLVLPIKGIHIGSDSAAASTDRGSTHIAEVVLSDSLVSAPQKSVIPARPIIIGLLAVLVISLAYFGIPGSDAATSNSPRPLRLTPVTSLSGEEFDPAISPDGERIAFSRVDEIAGSANIFVSAIGGDNPKALVQTSNFEASPTWSPDGRFVAFVRCDPETNEAAVYSILSSGEGAAEKLFDLTVSYCMALPQIDWSPTGDLIAYSLPDEENSSPGIWTFDISTKEKIQRTFPIAQMVDEVPRFDRLGERFAFSRGRSHIASGGDLFIGSLSGTEPTKLTDGEFDIAGFDWTAFEDALVVASQGALWKVDTMSGSQTWLAAPGIDVVQPVVNPADGTIVFVQSLFDVNIWSVDLNNSDQDAKILLATTRVDHDPRISPDGSKIAFISDRAGECGLFVADLDGTNERSVAGFDINCFDLRTPRWSPDGVTIAFEAGVEGNWDIYTVSTLGGSVVQVTDDPSKEWSPGWSADGETIYFSSDRTGIKRIYAIPLSGGEAISITETAGTIGQETADGSTLLYVRPMLDGLWALPLGQEATEPVQIIDDLSANDFRSWRINGNTVSYIRRGDQPEIVHFNLDTAVKTVSLELPTSLFNCAVADLSPDGTFAVFAQVDRDEDDLVMLEGLNP